MSKYLDNTGLSYLWGKLKATFALKSHTHSYAGSASAGGAAATALACTGNAATATKLQTARSIALSGGATGTATAFNGTGNITIPVTVLNPDNLSKAVPIGKGGTGATTAAGALSAMGVTATAQELNYVDGVTGNVQTQLNAKGAKSAAATATLTAAGWVGTEAPYTQALSVSGMTAAGNGIAGLSPSATADQLTAAADAFLTVTGQTNGTITVSAFGNKPEVDIPIGVIILG